MTRSPGKAASGRLGGFDILRCAAAVAVVVLHASAPYLQHPMPGLRWPVFDSPSPLADWIGWSIELSVMPLFLMIAGYFVPGLWDRLGTAAFLKHRALRLLMPLAVACVLILPADLYIWLTGWVVEGHIEPRKLRSLKFENGVDEGLWGLGHLWFLHYLFLYSMVWALLRQWRGRRDEDAVKPVPIVAIGLLVVVGWATLAAVPEVIFGFQHATLPVPSKWLYNGTFFAAGTLLATHSRWLQWVIRHHRALVLAGVAATAMGVLVGLQWLSGDVRWSTRLAAGGAAVVAAWTVALGLVGAAAGSRYTAGLRIRYLAAASFWVYLVHHPVVALAHIQLKVLLPMVHPLVKMLAATTTSLVFSLLSFEVLIRRRPLAQWLGTPGEFIKPWHPYRPERAAGPRYLRFPPLDPFGTRHSDTACLGDSSSGRLRRLWRDSSSDSIPSSSRARKRISRRCGG